MYKPGEMYSAVKSGIGSISRTMAVAGLVAVVAGCATEPLKPDFYPQKGGNNVTTYIDPKTKQEVPVFDLNGKWETNDYPYGREVVDITQNGNLFEGTKTIGSFDVSKGQTTIEGEINGNIVKCDVYHSRLSWQGASYEKIESNVNSFKCRDKVFKRLKK